VEEARVELINKVGENVTVRRFETLEAGKGARIGAYTHGTRIGVLVAVEGGRDDLGKDLAMHIAASRPQFISSEDVPRDIVEKEKAIFTAQAEDSGKPANIIEKMVQGRIQKHLNEITLLGQPFVKDPDQAVGKLLKSEGATVSSFQRLEVGEGLEKREDDFVAEVMAQAKGE
jgi:elongation factor Ts